ncbi:MAG: MFS transporter, partial [Hyphomicrobiales bacterium]|nr:MFS transporter [Hyphomicrobiales bacterium]
LSPQGLGLANAAFFISLTTAQIPIGMLFDRFGPRRVVTVLTVFTVMGAALHAVARSEAFFVLARFLVGLGCAGSFMAVVVLCVRWYAGPNFSTMLARVFALSGLGYLLAGSPWAAFSAGVGWRIAFAVSALFAAATGYFFFALARDHPGDGMIVRPERLRDIWRGFGEVWKTPGLVPILAVHFVSYAAFLTVFGVWAAPCLNDVYGFDPVSRGNVLVVMAVAQILATLGFGPLDRFLPRRIIVILAATISITTLAVLILVPHPSTRTAVLMLIIFSGATSFGVVNVADANSRFPARIAGRGATAVNLFQVVGTSVLPILSGMVIGYFPEGDQGRPDAAYRAAFAVVATSLAIGLAVYALIYPRARVKNRRTVRKAAE